MSIPSETEEAPDFYSLIQKDVPDFYSKVKPEPKKEESPDFYSLVKPQEKVTTTVLGEEEIAPKPKSWFQRFGELQAQQEDISIAQTTPESIKGAFKQAVGGTLEGATLGAVQVFPPDDENAQMARNYFEIAGTFGPVGLAQKGLGKVYSLIRNGAIRSLARLGGAGALGAGVNTTQTLFKTGELPKPEEVAKEGAIWIGIDAALQAVGLGTAFSQAVSNIAKTEKVPVSNVLSKLWKATKDKVKAKFGRDIKPENMTPQDVEVLMEEAQVAQKETLKPVMQIKIAEKPVATKEVSAPKQNDKDFFHQIQFASIGEPSVQQGQAKWIVDEMAKFGNDPSKIQEIAERMPMMWEQKDGKYVPSQAITESEKQPIKIREVGINDNKSTALQKLINIAQEAATIGKNEDAISYYNKAIDLAKKSQTSSEDYSPLVNDLNKRIERINSKKSNAVRPSKKPAIQKPESRKGSRIPPKITREKKPVMGKKQAAKRSDILNLFRKAFNDPIRLGKFRQKALGIHKGWPKVTRLLHDNDIETAAHEIGHNLHYTLYGGEAKTPQEQKSNVVKALNPYIKELKELAHYEPYTLEGFAEFTRMYVTNPEAARSLAPKFYQKFENDLDANFPELKNALIEAREYYDTYLEGTPQSRIRAQTDYASDASKLKNIIDWVKDNGNLDNLKTEFLDDVFPAKRLVAEAFGIPLREVEALKDPLNLYRALRLLKGAIGKADVFAMHETFNARTLEKTGEGLRQILQDIPILPEDEGYKEFSDYLIARRAGEKALQQIETGISFGDAISVEKDLREKNREMAERLDKFQDAVLRYAVDAALPGHTGLLSEAQYREIKKNNIMYVPFNRVMEPEKDAKASISGSIQAGKPIKRMKGSTRDIIAPLESTIKNLYSIIVNAEKNLAGQILAKLSEMKGIGSYVERVPTPMELKAKIYGTEVEKRIAKNLFAMGMTDLLEAKIINGKSEIGLREDLSEAIPDVFKKFGATSYPAGENIVTVYFDGKPQYYEVSPEIFEMWNKGTAPYVANKIVRVLRIPARTLRAGAILNPKFMQKNFVRDTWGGVLFSKYSKSIKDPVGLFIDTLYSPLAMLATAAKKGPLYVEWMKAGGGMSTMQSLDRDGVIKKLNEVRNGYSPLQVIKWLRKIAEISEEGNRLAEFFRAKEVEAKTRLGKEIAAFSSRDLSIDFLKIGLLTKALNQIIPFFNATLQGGDKLIRTLANAKSRKDFLPKIIAYVVIPSLILAWLNQDDENIKEFQEQEKDLNFIAKLGNDYLKIPVAFETGVLAHGLTQRMYRYFVEKDPEAFEGFMGSILSAAFPSFIPSFASPFIETYANKNFFTGGRIVPAAKERLTSKYQYKNYTSTTARLLGRAVNYMVGEDTRSKAASPAIIDHFITSWTGGLGRLMVSFSDASLEAAGLGDKIPKPEQTILERLGLNAFGARYPRSNTKSIEKFYDNYQDAMARVRSKDYARKTELEDEDEIGKAEERIEKLYDVNTLKRAYKAIQMCQREINNIMIDPAVTSSEKRELTDELYLQMIDFARSANKDMLEHRKEFK